MICPGKILSVSSSINFEVSTAEQVSELCCVGEAGGWSLDDLLRACLGDPMMACMPSDLSGGPKWVIAPSAGPIRPLWIRFAKSFAGASFSSDAPELQRQAPSGPPLQPAGTRRLCPSGRPPPSASGPGPAFPGWEAHLGSSRRPSRGVAPGPGGPSAGSAPAVPGWDAEGPARKREAGSHSPAVPISE